MDLKMATIKNAFEVLLDFRRQHPEPQVAALPEIQRLYKSLEPIIEAADEFSGLGGEFPQHKEQKQQKKNSPMNDSNNNSIQIPDDNTPPQLASSEQ